MPKNPEQESNTLSESLFEKNQRLISNKFFARFRHGDKTKEENPHNHFCVYFAAYDPQAKEVFIGHHKKSELWLFNGGHINKNESPVRALEREMREEWGFETKTEGNGGPSLRTITDIKNAEQSCKLHYDYWYFIPVSKENFNPKEKLLKKEFYTTGWKTVDEAQKLIIDPNTLLAIEQIQRRFINS